MNKFSWFVLIVVIAFQERRLVCFDGDLDPVHIENMKTVMGESKMLTLGNGECIRMENHCAILFEVVQQTYPYECVED